ncbi:MAG: ABC transporter ATP-binding protein [Candidatus Margulisiibacteriota bacterium]
MTALSISNLICGYGEKVVINGISIEVKIGEFVGIVGPNGCGKTTMLRAIAGLIAKKSGEISVYGKNIDELSRRELAREIAFVPQLMEPVEGFSVIDMVLLGRTPYIDRFEFESDDDYQIAKWAIEELKMGPLMNKEVSELSGGEFQRAAIARALAQEPRLMLLDEPISHLDIRQQINILKLLRKIRAQRTIVATFHDLNMAARFCQKLVLMKKGEVVASGWPDEVLTKENIWKAYRVKAEVRKNEKNKHARLILLP